MLAYPASRHHKVHYYRLGSVFPSLEMHIRRYILSTYRGRWRKVFMEMKFDVNQKIAIYARHSNSQSELDDQVRKLMDDVEAAGGYVEYENIYADLCHVGAKQEALKQLLQDVAAKGFKGVVVSDPSRISRKVYEIVEVASIFVEQGAKLYFISDREIVDSSELL